MGDEAKNAIPDTAQVSEGVSNAANSIKESMGSTMDDFSSKNVMNASNEFLASNSMIAKFMFIVLVLIVFLILLNLGMYLVYYLTNPNTSPYIFTGMKSGTEYSAPVSQDPGSSTSVVIYRSNNQSTGIEFTWSTWLKFDSVPTSGGSTYKNIFVKGTNDFDSSTGQSKVNNGPGLYVTRAADGSGNGCQLYFIMDVVSPKEGTQKVASAMSVPNVPIGKWVHVAFRLQNKILDCYVNGVITTRLSLGDYIPKQNYDDIIVSGNGGFAGAISNLRYYDYALSVFEINSVVYYGPNLNAASGGGTGFYDYLGKIWYSGSSSASYQS
jgi:hypothetical protein